MGPAEDHIGRPIPLLVTAQTALDCEGAKWELFHVNEHIPAAVPAGDHECLLCGGIVDLTSKKNKDSAKLD
jgi:hypothetical protein